MQRRGASGKKGVGEIFGGLFLDLNLEMGLEKVTGRGLSSNNYTPKLSPTQNYLAGHLGRQERLVRLFPSLLHNGESALGSEM